ncbi:MAG TPA: hypothetical protein VL426_04265 [Candidatus Binatia bacterium]|jgi:hypothetical protein|nr:hypothetical protein [Candidatus Binatia bacterium]
MRFFAKQAEKLPAGAGYLGVFLLVAAIYGWFQMSPTFLDPDSFYHVKMTMLLMQRGVIKDFVWLPYTTLAHAYTDHHFLYHVLLIPFVAAFGPLVGSKIATVLFGALTMTAFYAVLRVHGSRWPFAFTMLLATSSAFMFRMNLTKTSSLSVGFLMLALIAIKKEKPLLLFFLSWAYVLLYGGWPILGVVVAVFLGTRAVIDHLLEKHPVHSWAAPWFWRRLLTGSKAARKDFFMAIEVRQALATAAGLAAGIVINPYFPQNLRFYWEQIVQIAVLGYKDKIGVGVEWYPFSGNQFFAESSAIFLGFAVCLVILASMVFWGDLVKPGRAKNERGEITSQLASFFLAAFFALMTMRSRRHIEYFAPFAVMSMALFFTMLTSRLDVKAFVGRIRWLFPRPQFVPFAILTYVALLFVFLGARDVVGNKMTYSGGIPWTHYAKAADWLIKNTPEGAIVLHSDWDDFPPLFFRDDHNRYIVGLDPTFLYRQDPARYWEWVNITTGKTDKGLAEAVRTRFDSRYILVENDHTEMRAQVEHDPRCRRVYQDDDAGIYEVR